MGRGLGLFESACIVFSKTLLYFYQKYISSYILYYSDLIEICQFSRRNSLKSAGLYRGINVVVSVGLVVEIVVVSVVLIGVEFVIL